ncbi:MAG: C2H2-type zinc finger protein [Solobacterium sp.]|jgi:PBP1b-binding outer membrane lipoprotein LpoB|nr:C2H2-type zinc finger protein [Solobacterium sp.]MCH4049709.1 C2H2-type zinc finger protein [Solobacterium sp.]MCH4073394.1 C2H2-type zinc finger protein [Solobacterium sp.]MCI1313053.1 C2H2-type zinc finger protein [Solobacterium sp.]MCI1345514.1 C2H2-type zinc finger protein [Solobacterium sp.]
MPLYQLTKVTAALLMAVSLAACGSSDTAVKSADPGFYKDAEIISSGSSLRQSVLYFPTDELTEADLTDWYFNYIEENMLNSAVILDDAKSTEGIYANAATDMVYTGIELKKRDNGTYSANITSAGTTYSAKNGKLTLVSQKDKSEKETAEPEASASASASASSSSSSKSSSKASSKPTATPTPTPSASSDEVADDGTYYQCDQCGKHFATYELWLQHIRDEHGSQGSYHIYNANTSGDTASDDTSENSDTE